MTVFRLVLSWTLFAGSTVGMGVSYWLWTRGKVSEKGMVGMTLLLSWLALQFSAITTIFVA